MLKISLFFMFVFLFLSNNSVFTVQGVYNPNISYMIRSMASKDGPYIDTYLENEGNKTIFKFELHHGSKKDYSNDAVITIGDYSCRTPLIYIRDYLKYEGECELDVNIFELTKNDEYTFNIIPIDEKGNEIVIDYSLGDVKLSFTNKLRPLNYSNTDFNWGDLRFDFIHVPKNKITRVHGKAYIYIILPVKDKYPVGDLYMDLELMGGGSKYNVYKNKKLQLNYIEEIGEYGAIVVIDIEDLYYTSLEGMYKIIEKKGYYKERNLYRKIHVEGKIYEGIYTYQDLKEVIKEEEQEKEKHEKLRKEQKKYNERLNSINKKLKARIDKVYEKLVKIYKDESKVSSVVNILIGKLEVIRNDKNTLLIDDIIFLLEHKIKQYN